MRLPISPGFIGALACALPLVSGCSRRRDPWWTDPEATWITVYGGAGSDVDGDILAAEGRGYFVVGTSDLTYGTEPQGDVYVIRTDPALQVVWERTYGGDGLQRGESIVRSSDGALVIAGSSSSGDGGGMDAYLLELDEEGDVLWSRTMGGALDEWGSTAFETSDGGYLLVGDAVDPSDPVSDSGVAGYFGYSGRSSIYLAKTDAGGNELWTRSYDSGDNVFAWSGVPLEDGGALVLATVTFFPDPDDDLLLLRVDENGEEVWSRTWEEGRRAGYDLIATPDGNYLAVGSYAPPGDTGRTTADFLFVKVDSEGNELWSRTWGAPSTIEYGEAVTTAPDGGYVAVGDRTGDLFSQCEDVLLVAIDANGEPLWERVFETATHNMYGGIARGPDDTYAVTGSTLMEDGTFDVFVIETDAGGHAGE